MTPHIVCRAYKKYFLAVFSSASSCISHEKSRRPVSQASDVPLKLKAVSAFSLSLSAAAAAAASELESELGAELKGKDQIAQVCGTYVEDWVDQEASIC